MENLFSKWLLVSDIDGTLNDKRSKLPEKNRTAITDFVNKGGNFTLCSGRNLQSLTIHYNKLGIKEPAIFLNGAGIYDFNTDRILNYDVISSEGEKVIIDLLSEYSFAQLTVFTPNKLYRVKRSCLYGYFVSKADKLDCELCKTVDELPRGVWGKVTFFGTPSLVKKLKKFFSEDENKKLFETFFTSPVTLEVVNKGVNKGAGVKKLAEILSIDKNNTAAIGDYYNDVDMLKCVAHPACCGQAPDDIKAISEYVTCHCNNGAVADFINYLETNYIK